MTTASTTGPLTVVKPEGPDNINTFHTTPGSGEHENLDNINAEFHHTTGHDHSVKGALVPNAGLAADVARANLLVNGGFEIWQRGAGAFTGSGVYTADRWVTSLAAGDAVSITRVSGIGGDTTYYSARVVYTKAAGGSSLQQGISGSNVLNYLLGKTLSLSAKVATATANAVRLGIYHNGTGSNAYSDYHTGSGAWETLTVTTTIPNDATTIVAYFWFGVSCTADLDSAMFCISPVPVTYAPMHPAEEWARCQRYYEVTDGAAWLQICVNAAAAQGYGTPLFFKATKPVSPTCTKVGTWMVSNCGQPGTANIGVYGCWINISASGAGYTYAYPNSADDLVTVEAND